MCCAKINRYRGEIGERERENRRMHAVHGHTVAIILTEHHAVTSPASTPLSCMLCRSVKLSCCQINMTFCNRVYWYMRLNECPTQSLSPALILCAARCTFLMVGDKTHVTFSQKLHISLMNIHTSPTCSVVVTLFFRSTDVFSKLVLQSYIPFMRNL